MTMIGTVCGSLTHVLVLAVLLVVRLEVVSSFVPATTAALIGTCQCDIHTSRPGWMSTRSGGCCASTSQAAASPASSSSLAQPPLSTSPLSLSLKDLSVVLGGKGRAQAVWDYYRRGEDPLIKQQQHQVQSTNNHQQQPSLGSQARRLLYNFCNGQTLSESVGHLVHATSASDGTTKLLIQLHDGLQVETVLIPWQNNNNNKHQNHHQNQHCTLCISSQVGCRQACRFCLTGRMGLQRSLSADEILVQVYWAQHVVRQKSDVLYPIHNVVFMGMGEPADNVPAVVQAARVLTDDHQFALAPRRVTISTVAPTAAAFDQLAAAPARLAWSVHASKQSTRQALVPTTTDSMIDLRQALQDALLRRPSRRLRSVMLEVTLLYRINDSVQDAQHLAAFCQPLLQNVPGIKLVVNLIPWNDINSSLAPSTLSARYQTPPMERIWAFQKVLTECRIQCHIRTARGDDSSAACGQLATKTTRAKKQKQPQP